MNAARYPGSPQAGWRPLRVAIPWREGGSRNVIMRACRPLSRLEWDRRRGRVLARDRGRFGRWGFVSKRGGRWHLATLRRGLARLAG